MSNSETPFESIGSDLRSLREEAGLTLKDVATAVHLDVSLLSKIERGVRLPTEDQCQSLSKFYGVSAESLTRERLLSKVYYDLGTSPEFDQFTNQVREPGVQYLDNRSIGLMGLLDYRRVDIASQTSSERQSRLGQYFTPSNIAEFMAEMVGESSLEHIRILDPGAGIGSLTAAFVMRLVQQPVRPKSIEVTAFEIDPLIRSHLEVTLSVCRSHCREAGVDFVAEIIAEDFILHTRHQFENGLFEAAPRLYTHAILNPPYKKISSKSEQRHALSSLGIETGNLYSAFTALAIKWLQTGGELVAITPRSFCNGSYFIPFRKFVFEQTALRRLHVFEHRDLAFSDDHVLQENIIFSLTKGSKSDQVVVSCSSGADWNLLTSRTIDVAQVVDVGSREQIIHIAVNDFDQGIVEQMNALPCNLKGLGVGVSTGRVVDFRSKEFLRMDSAAGCVPLIYPGHMKDGGIEHPKKEFRKAQFIEACETTESLFSSSGNYVLVKRFSAKEEPRRIMAAVCSTEVAVGFENHLNVYHADGQGLPLNVARGLALFLNSALVDMYFRLFSGHTQVNAGDLKRLNYPHLDTLEKWGKIYGKVVGDQDMIDELIEAEASRMAPSKRPSKRKIKQRINEALTILKALGLPKEQQNERSALTLLALAGLAPENEWESVNSPQIGITPIMDFCGTEIIQNSDC